MPGLRIIQLSDCHVSASADAIYRGHHALEGLKSIVHITRQWRPDLVVASGDLSEDGSRISYSLLAEVLSQTAATVCLLPGNHDDMELMRDVFSADPFLIANECVTDSWRLHFLDTTIPKNPAGRVEKSAARRLAAEIIDQPEPHAFLFMHHQPWLSGSAWIDKYGLMQADDFRAELADCSKLRGVGWGHVHHGWELEQDGVWWLGCPSTVSNTLPYSEKFTLDDRGPACRWLELSESGAISSGLLYAES